MKDGKPTGIYEDFLAELLDNDTVWVGRQASRSRDGALLLGLLISESLERCGFFQSATIHVCRAIDVHDRAMAQSERLTLC